MDNKIVKFINKIIWHNRDDEGDYGIRVVVHVPIGIIMLLITTEVHWAAGIILAWLFLKYERNEDVHTEDEAWKDIFGAIVGLIIGVIIKVVFLCTE